MCTNPFPCGICPNQVPKTPNHVQFSFSLSYTKNQIAQSSAKIKPIAVNAAASLLMVVVDAAPTNIGRAEVVVSTENPALVVALAERFARAVVEMTPLLIAVLRVEPLAVLDTPAGTVLTAGIPVMTPAEFVNVV